MFELQFRGNARVYLQGKDALEPISLSTNGHIAYYIACPDSAIMVHDFRRNSIEAARHAINNHDDTEFADVFNQSAWIEIYDLDECTEIFLREIEPVKDTGPLLWLGVLEKDEMPNYEILWESMSQVTNERIAFAALIP